VTYYGAGISKPIEIIDMVVWSGLFPEGGTGRSKLGQGRDTVKQLLN